ncbi:MAG TPA: NUDIX hydrolase [Patescibacteria group bacterium]|nr:NUDIX hydrolase [Patescibacteria group bacterium]
MAEILTAWIGNKAFLRKPSGKILLGCDSGNAKGHEKVKGYWGVPGGRMDVGEVDIFAALARELKEEAGFELGDIEPQLLASNLITRHDGKHLLLQYYVVDVSEDFEAKISEEHSELAWADPYTALTTMNVFDALKGPLKKLCNLMDLEKLNSTPVSKDEPVLG